MYSVQESAPPTGVWCDTHVHVVSDRRLCAWCRYGQIFEKVNLIYSHNIDFSVQYSRYDMSAKMTYLYSVFRMHSWVDRLDISY